VSNSPALAGAVTGAFRLGPEPLGLDALVLGLAEGLLAEDGALPPARAPRHLDHAALERARALLDERLAIVRSVELEAVTGLPRYELARQFRSLYGTSPYRYSLLRRLDFARSRLGRGPLAELALAAGFVDQAHFTRVFRSAFGLTPGRYARLRGANGSVRPRGVERPIASAASSP
jgi:AraC-like DNA-binding protein